MPETFPKRRNLEEEEIPRPTPREAEVLSYVAQGLKSAEIAEELVIACRTVEFHINNMMRKWKVHNRVRMINFAREHGFVK